MNKRRVVFEQRNSLGFPTAASSCVCALPENNDQPKIADSGELIIAIKEILENPTEWIT